MRYIAHRGLIDGPNLEMENNPVAILNSLKAGYDCEIDLWIHEKKIFLGHDGGQYKIEDQFLFSNSDKLWIHAKNLESLAWLSGKYLNYFWHQSDDYVITSRGWIWTYPGKELTVRSVCVKPEITMDLLYCKNLDCYAICSEYVREIRGDI